MEKRFCDGCDKEIDEEKGFFIVEQKRKEVYDSVKPTEFYIPRGKTLDFCSLKCLNSWSKEQLEKIGGEKNE